MTDKPTSEQNDFQKKRNKRLIVILLFVAVGMFGFGYLLVPFYDMFCQIAGINGKTGGPVLYSSSMDVDRERKISVQFVVTNNADLAWDFHPKVGSIEVYPGEKTQTAFYAKNTSDQRMTVQAIPSVTPGIAAKYFKKTECFCFTQQTFEAQESMEMPLIFFIDPELPKEIKEITLSYTLFDAGQFITNTKKNAEAPAGSG